MPTEVSRKQEVVSLPTDKPVWEHVFTVAPLVVVGSREADGSYDFAPKHMAMPLSWENYYGFVCTPRHSTYQNILRTGVFTISYPRPSQVVLTTLGATQRCNDGSKPRLEALATFAAQQVDGLFLKDAYFFLECELERMIDDMGENSLIIGRVVAAHAAADSLRTSDQDDADLIQQAPLLAYLDWGRFSRIEQSYAFPFMRDFKR